jgi:hypothetical protein
VPGELIEVVHDAVHRRQKTKRPVTFCASTGRFYSRFVGAGEGIRTLDVNLGKVALYH